MKTNPILLTLLLLVFFASAVCAQGTGFTYQGRLSDNGGPAHGSYDLQFVLFDATSGGNAIGGTNTRAPLAVSGGVFTTALDFGSTAFNGSARWLQIAVRTNGSAAAHTPLLPRQAITATPYAIHATEAATLNGQLASAFAPASGSSQYVSKAGDTMSGPLALPANGLAVGNSQLVLRVSNVGIGTSNPQHKLQVEGIISANSGFVTPLGNTTGRIVGQYQNIGGFPSDLVLSANHSTVNSAQDFSLYGTALVRISSGQQGGADPGFIEFATGAVNTPPIPPHAHQLCGQCRHRHDFSRSETRRGRNDHCRILYFGWRRCLLRKPRWLLGVGAAHR